MKKYLVKIIALCLTLEVSCAQETPNNEFIDSFTVLNSSSIVDFGFAVNSGKEMSQEEALKYIYNNDTSKLYCKQRIFNMETEKVEGISSDLYLPKKAFRISGDDYTLIAYSFYDCQNPDEPLRILMEVSIFGEKDSFERSLIVYSGTDYDFRITGLFNPISKKVFLIGDIDGNGKKLASLYTINATDLKFDMVYESNAFQVDSGDLFHALDALGWKEAFIR